MIGIQDRRIHGRIVGIHGRNVGGCQGRLSQSLTWTPRSSQVMQDSRALILISHKAQILVTKNCDFCYGRFGYI